MTEHEFAINLEGYITRKNAARIIHDFLRKSLKEPDEIDGSPAYQLQDLFDCRVCAGHIIQVYVKGIMEGVTLPDGRLIFKADQVVSREELLDILTRVCYPEFRMPKLAPCNQNQAATVPEAISFEQVLYCLREKQHVLLVDVRTERDFEQGHLENAENVPLISIIKNPFVFSENRNKRILLYCEEGVQSEAATRCLMEAGYKNVAYFAWKDIRRSRRSILSENV